MITTNLQKARNWNKDKVRTLGGAYANAMKTIYGYEYQYVDLYSNRKAYYDRQNQGKPAIYSTEI
jgi:hypothetical protein